MIHVGDCLESLRAMEADTVQTCITSPPYFGLRDYGHEGQIGLEDTPDAYAQRLVEVFREVWRVLRDDGTVWINLGDSYNTRLSGQSNGIGSSYGNAPGTEGHERPCRDATAIKRDLCDGLKQKDLIGIPWLVAFALRADGWYLRQEIIWRKPNPMPESVRDRCTKSHEQIFLLSKSPRYYFDSDAIKEQATNRPPGNTQATKGGREYVSGEERHRTAANLHGIGARQTRNKRSVWDVASRPFSGAHFAVFPPDLIRPCVVAGTSEKGHCPDCGMPWIRQTERFDHGYNGSAYGERAVKASGGAISGGTQRSTLGSSKGAETGQRVTRGWGPQCDCGSDPVPDLVLDPFAGAGTTGIVCAEERREFIGCEINPEYAALAEQRIEEARRSLIGGGQQLTLAEAPA